MITKKENYNVAVFGNGQIGSVIREMLQEHTYFNVSCYDKISTDAGVKELDANNLDEVYDAVEKADIIVSALPFDVTKNIAFAVAEAGNRIYLDLTEDVFAAQELIQYNKLQANGSIMIPHCGLAPGAISIIASSLAKKFNDVISIEMMVGALPITVNNYLKYLLSWSTAGLINEYCNACPAIKNGVATELNPLEDYKLVSIDGTTYEAFNTSGGLGTLADSVLNGELIGIKFDPDVNVTYQTLRYPGHRDLMKFLLKELKFEKHRWDLVELLDKSLPRSINDVIVMSAIVTGHKDNSHQECVEIYQRKIYSNPRFSAIQLTTAGGVCAVVNWLEWAINFNQLGSYVKEDFSLTCESIPLAKISEYAYWPYK